MEKRCLLRSTAGLAGWLTRPGCGDGGGRSLYGSGLARQRGEPFNEQLANNYPFNPRSAQDAHWMPSNASLNRMAYWIPSTAEPEAVYRQ